MKNTHILDRNGKLYDCYAHRICKVLSPEIPRLMPALPSLTGCDTISALFGIGEKKVWKVVESLEKNGILPQLDLMDT
jgi:hypothetical protein